MRWTLLNWLGILQFSPAILQIILTRGGKMFDGLLNKKRAQGAE